METLNFLKKIHSFLANPNPESLKMTLDNVPHEGLMSIVIDGTEPGKLTRIFVAKKDISPLAIALHTHRYPLKITVLQGVFRHHTATKQVGWSARGVKLPVYNYSSKLLGGSGLKNVGESNFILDDFYLPALSVIRMGVSDYHTVSCLSNTVWVVEELGIERSFFSALGAPFDTNSLYAKVDVLDSKFIAVDSLKTLVEKLITDLNSTLW